MLLVELNKKGEGLRSSESVFHQIQQERFLSPESF